MTPIRQTRVFLHLFLLCGLAIAQPLYDLAGKSPEFLVAHRLEPAHLFASVALLSLGLPLALFLVQGLFRLLSDKAGHAVLGLLVTALTLLVASPFTRTWVPDDGLLALILALAIALAATIAYFRSRGMRLFMNWFSLAGIVFAVNFLAFSPASEVAFPASSDAEQPRVEPARTPPLIMVMFDEFPLASLLDGEGNINADRFPNFARLADSAAWYRFHTTNSDSTLISVPNILSGSMPFGRYTGLPSQAAYPGNLFSLLGEHYRVVATEHGTRLCPDKVCDPQPVQPDVLLSDALVILGHFWLPAEFTGNLPSTSNAWAGFGGDPVNVIEEPESADAILRSINWRDRGRQFQAFIDGISAESGRLYYLHSLFPHASWQFLPDGRLMTAGGGGQVTGIRPNVAGSAIKHVWYESEPAARVGHQRHLLQVGYVDTLIGTLIRRLEELGIYDDALVVITADHGASFDAGHSRRNVDGDNWVEIASVPLMIKYPGNSPAGEQDLNSQGMDILPTILDALNAQGWEGYDGQSLLGPARDESVEKALFADTGVPATVSFSRFRELFREEARETALAFGTGGFDSVYRAGDELGLVGTPVATHEIAVREAPGVTYRHAEYLENASPGGAIIQSVIHGTLSGEPADNPSSLLAISVGGTIRAVTGPLGIPGEENSFQVIVPPAEIESHPGEIRTFFVMPRDGARPVLVEAPPETGPDYRLTSRGNGNDPAWSLWIDGKEIPVVLGEVPGWTSTLPDRSHGTVRIGGWAADLAAEKPAARILVFVDGSFYTSAVPDRENPKVADDFDMPGILKSAFRIPVLIQPGRATSELEVRVFALSHAGEVSELIYPDHPNRWAFQMNPRPAGPAIKPYR